MAETAYPGSDFLQFSARCGNDPLRVQGPGGNTSFKAGAVMWIKASGTELANAQTQTIFIAVDLGAACAEAAGAGDGSCKAAVIGDGVTLRPSIETTFHSIMDWTVVAHIHSIAVLAHAISPQGRSEATRKLAGLPFILVPYRKPGRPLTSEIMARISPDTQIVVLENHGLIVAGDSVDAVARLMDEVEALLAMPALVATDDMPDIAAPEGYAWHTASTVLARNARLTELAVGGSYYPDHVVFLGPGLPCVPTPSSPAVLVHGTGVALKTDATPAQNAMLRCLTDVLSRLPAEWNVGPIGSVAEAELLNWDAEKYRQALAGRGA